MVLALTLMLASAPNALEYELKADAPITVGLGAWWLFSEYAFKDQLAPSHCRWCARDALDDAARGIRAPTLDGQRMASRVSDVVATLGTPVAIIGLDAVLALTSGGTWRDWLVDSLLIAEAVMASQALCQSLKFVIGRERPFVAALSEDQKRLTTEPTDNNVSFYSAHSSFTFSLVVAGATIARARGYRYWWVVLAAGLPLAVATGTLRMVADKHYLTDVLTGAAMGALIGWAIPTLFHRPVHVGPVEAAVTVAPGGVGVAGRW